MRHATLLTRNIDRLIFYALQKTDPLRFLMLFWLSFFAFYITTFIFLCQYDLFVSTLLFIASFLFIRPCLRYFVICIDHKFRHNPFRLKI